MGKYTVTIENSLPGSSTYLGQTKTLIKNEEKSTLQILNLILSYPIFYKTKINSTPAYIYSHTYPALPSRVTEAIYSYLEFIEFSNNILIVSYWNIVINTETTIMIEKLS